MCVVHPSITLVGIMQLITLYRLRSVKKLCLCVIVCSCVCVLCVLVVLVPSGRRSAQPELLPVWRQHQMEEIEFPLAFAIMVYRDPEQFERLFRAIYRPFNVYCLHADANSDKAVMDTVHRLSFKYANVVLPSRFVDVVHSEFSVLESELVCMEALYRFKKIRWRYFINLTGQEWPLKVNLELVRILKSLHGANLIEKVRINPERIPKSAGPIPHEIRIWKGAVHIIAVRDFVEFALYDPHASALLDFLRNTAIPDETYFSTLNHDHKLRAPGGYCGDFERDPIKYPFINRYKIWETEGVCHGKFIRHICVFSMADVPAMVDKNNVKLFANKFMMDVNPDVFDYMEQWFYNRSRVVYSDTTRNPFINLTYYSQLTVVHNHF